MKFSLLIATVVTAYSQLSSCVTIYVSPTGSDSGTGTITSPLKSIQSAVDLATAGSTIYLRGGTYALTKNVQFSKSGTSSAPYIVSAYSTEKVILDGEALTGTPAAVGGSLANADRGIFHIQNANYWRFYNLEFINGPYGVYNRDASNNYFEKIITRDNYESGFQLEGASANNVVLYLDSYGNRDPRKNGESADGFACKSGSGTGNVLRGARIWNNVDDGVDLWEFASPVTIENTIVWGNGYNRWGFSDFAGDGNGFKLGGGSTGAIPAANHIIKNCISFLNAVDGFIDNGQAGSLTLTRNTAFNNGRHGFRFGSSTSTFTSNIAASNKGNPTDVTGTQTQSGNSWNIGGTWSNATFKSVSASIMAGARASDGKIVGSDFLLPTSGAAIGATTYW
ncbi:pectate lyase [Bisporella sp. PMI_857]|nr:pectate lyase [Bisporella sp. PMI_857]